MFSESIHNPMLMDRYLSLKATRYVYGAANAFASEFSIRPDGLMATRAKDVLREAKNLLTEVERDTLWEAVKRHLCGRRNEHARVAKGSRAWSSVIPRT